MYASCPGTIPNDVTNIQGTSHTFDLAPLGGPAPITLIQPVNVYVTDAMGCVSNVVSPSNGPSGLHPWIFDDAQNAFSAQVVPVDCAAGIFTVTLVDDPNDGGTPFDVSFTQSQYALVRNGVTVASGWWESIHQTSPDRLVFASLQPGAYTLNYTFGPSNYGIHCPASGSIGFVVPNAGDCNTNVMLRAALQGPLPSGTVMTDGLRSLNLIPTTEPYSALGYVFTGSAPGATITPAQLAVTGNDAIEDWVVVELRDPAAPAQVLYSKAALIQRDGDVMDTDGDGYLSFPVAAGTYYVALKHRDHLGVMTSTARELGLAPVTIDLRSASTACYGLNPRAQVGGVYCLWAGDANGDSVLKYTGSGNDRDPIILAVGGSTPNNTLNNVYDRRDTNMDGSIRYTGTNNDRDNILINVGSTVPTNTRAQQLP